MTLGIFLVLVLANPLIANSPTTPDEVMTTQKNSLIGWNIPYISHKNASLGVLLAEDEANYPSDMERLTGENILVDTMAICESTDNPLAVNLVDRDGTSSFGRFQFKPKTLRHYADKYRLADVSAWDEADTMNWIYDGEFQEQIFRKMLYDKGVVWTQEFPVCFARYKDLFIKLWR